MSSYIDLKFINEISGRLGQFKKKGDYLFNFRCPHCGDSKKSKTKARAYLYQVKNDMLEHGYGGYEKATGSKPAPGGAGSAFNEIISGEGVHMLDENSDMSEEELAMKMYEMTKDTTLGKEQKKTAGIKAGEIPDVENKELYTKCLVSARSAKKKHE